jgi:hypothetical protein
MGVYAQVGEVRVVTGELWSNLLELKVEARRGLGV